MAIYSNFGGELPRILVPRTWVNKDRRKGHGLLRRFPPPSLPEQIYPRTSTARTHLRAPYLPSTSPITRAPPATPETTRRLALSASRQGLQWWSASCSASWWAASYACPIPLPQQLLPRGVPA